MRKELPHISPDHALDSQNALELDELQRKGFAAAAVAALERVSATSGFVLSIDGRWGSGKSSTLAMIEQLIHKESDPAPIVVHFNPWLVGDRDSLLRQFLGAIASALELTDHAANAKKVATELSNYSKVFDLLKWVPGAEPWASIIKGVVKSAGDAAGGFADQRSRDIDAQKSRLETELKCLDRRILVIIDDVDRLFPTEAFEMVRIIKAVGQLPNIGYVLAWDPEYVRRALKSLAVPHADTYLDKIVQIRLPLPPLTPEAKLRLLNKALESLSPAALDMHFPKQEERMQMLYFQGLRDLLEQPRDITRVLNTVSVIEPGLRGEVVFADILGLACLMVRAPRIYDVLRRDPELFLGSLPSKPVGLESKEAQRQFKALMEDLYAKSGSPDAVRRLVHHLFPDVQRASSGYVLRSAVVSEGHLASRSRLGIATQLGIGTSDVSLVDARRYLTYPVARPEVAAKLNKNNALGFLEMLSDFGSVISKEEVDDLPGLCLAISRMVDTPPYSVGLLPRAFLAIPAEDIAHRAITRTVAAVGAKQTGAIAYLLAADKASLTIAAQVLRDGLSKNPDPQALVCTTAKQSKAASVFAKNIVDSLDDGTLWDRTSPAHILWSLMRVAPAHGSRVLAALKRDDPTLDKFALNFLRHGFSSSGGQSYAVPEDKVAVANLIKLSSLKAHAKKRLKDSSADYPLRAAWQSVVEDKALYGDGSDARF